MLFFIFPAWFAAVIAFFWELGPGVPRWALLLLAAGWVGVLVAVIKAVERIWPEIPQQEEAGEGEDPGELKDAA